MIATVLQKPLRRFLRVALLTPLFIGCFYSKDLANGHVKDVFRTLCRLLGCLLLFTFANVLKTLLAKIMASHFHKEAHFEKMQEALQKVGDHSLFLLLLLYLLLLLLCCCATLRLQCHLCCPVTYRSSSCCAVIACAGCFVVLVLCTS